MLDGDQNTFTRLRAEVAPIKDNGQTNLEDQQVNLSTFLLAGNQTTFNSLLAEVDPIEDGGQTNLEDQQVNLNTCTLMSDLSTCNLSRSFTKLCPF